MPENNISLQVSFKLSPKYHSVVVAQQNVHFTIHLALQINVSYVATKAIIGTVQYIRGLNSRFSEFTSSSQQCLWSAGKRAKENLEFNHRPKNKGSMVLL